MSQTLEYPFHFLPPYYRCTCGKKGCKLWRDPESADGILLCMTCVCALTNKNPSSINEKGKLVLESPGRYGGVSDYIGPYIPAIPSPDGKIWYRYVLLPIEGILWWRRLPHK